MKDSIITEYFKRNVEAINELEDNSVKLKELETAIKELDPVFDYKVKAKLEELWTEFCINNIIEIKKCF